MFDTGHNFPEVTAFRDHRAKQLGAELIVRSVEDSRKRGTVRLTRPDESRNVHQSVTLLEAIEEFRFDALIGGARRDEEKARAKERIFSHRDSFGQWQPKEQRPELWTLFNTRHRPGEHFRSFPISNWTELDVWLYIARENIPLPNLYYKHERQVILADQLDTREKKAAGQPIDLSRLTDGLEAEREQGITIDVAYRYFATKKRKFIIADAPGHEQYTRNMVTAAAGSDAAVVLVDITKLDLGARPVKLLPQTRRHTLLAQLLRIPAIVFAVNKLDAVAEPGPAFAAVREALREFAAQAGLEVAGIVPVSALRGDNVTAALDVPWYRGPSLLELLESLPAAQEDAAGPLSIP